MARARAADDGDGLVSRLRLRADLRRRLRQHRGRAGEPPHGLEITNYIYPNPWVALDLDLSFSRARFLDVPDGEDFVPGALNRVISGGHRGEPARRRRARAVRQLPAAALRSAAAASRTTASKSKSTSIVNGEIGYKFSERIRLTLEGFNLFDAEVSDIDYFFESRLRDEPAPVEDIHFHAAIPRSARVALRVSF